MQVEKKMFSEVLPTNIFEYSFVLVISNQSLGLSKYIDKKNVAYNIIRWGEKFKTFKLQFRYFLISIAKLTSLKNEINSIFALFLLL